MSQLTYNFNLDGDGDGKDLTSKCGTTEPPQGGNEYVFLLSRRLFRNPRIPPGGGILRFRLPYERRPPPSMQKKALALFEHVLSTRK
jgi:hypothetical protein